jgi:D-alanyl-lipoteichoic acid acyltransferase DltB (MBOAT superfamily)
MVLGGLWHGANWTFLWWGVFHGAWLTIYHAFRTWRAAPEVPRFRIVSIFLTFHLVCISWVFFRSESIAAAWYTLQKMFQMPQGSVTLLPYALFCALLYFVMAAEELLSIGKYFERLPLIARACLILVALASLAIFTPVKRIAFIYFQF